MSGSSSNAVDAVSMRRSISARSMPWFSQPKASSPRTSTLKNWDFGFWNTEPTRRAVSCSGASAASSPPTRTRPSTRPS